MNDNMPIEARPHMWGRNAKRAEFKELVGLSIKYIFVDKDKDFIVFGTHEGKLFGMWHEQDCCECVTVDDIIGDLNDLLDTPILTAEERTSNGEESPRPVAPDDSETWTFYELRTIKGSVTLRWYGTSNGYYSEGVDFYRYQREGH